jgi:hypothetical protein
VDWSCEPFHKILDGSDCGSASFEAHISSLFLAIAHFDIQTTTTMIEAKNYPVWGSANHLEDLKDDGLLIEMKGENEVLKYKLSKEGCIMGQRVMGVLYRGECISVVCKITTRPLDETHRMFTIVVSSSWFPYPWRRRQVMLCRTKRSPKVRKFMRADGGPASAWRDFPTSAKEEEAKKVTSVPGFVNLVRGIYFATPSLRGVDFDAPSLMNGSSVAAGEITIVKSVAADVVRRTQEGP